MMQDTLLRVCVMALSLVMYPRDDPGVENITTVAMQKYEEKLLRGGHQLDLDMTPDSDEPQMDVKQILSEENESDPRLTGGERMLVSESLEESGANASNLDPDLPQNSVSDPKVPFKTSEIEQMKEEIQIESSLGDQSRPQGHQDKQGKEEEEEISSHLSHLNTRTSDKGASEGAIIDWERDYVWYIWNTFSIISMIRWFRKYLGRTSHIEEEKSRILSASCRAADVPLPDAETLQCFHSKCIQASSDKKWREEEFLDGFLNDLLDSMQTVGDTAGGMAIEDFQMLNACDITVPFRPKEPYSFQCQLLNSNQTSDLMADMQVCGHIKLVEHKVQPGCPCQSPGAEDVVCLLHCDTESVKTRITEVFDGPLCLKNSPFLLKSQVSRWFQSTIKQAWALISHKYEFELNIRYIEAPGALVVRFRSGKRINFTLNPVVKFNSDTHFFIAPHCPNNLDSFWTLSLTNYENHFLQHFSQQLPEHSCHNQTLEIAYFLHKRQVALSGSSALKHVHFKTALMHLLLTKAPSQWRSGCLSCRLRDLFDFMEKSLEKKFLPHVLVGNPVLQRALALPAEFAFAKPVNLFQPLVAHDCIYRNTTLHFQEMLKNAPMLIQDYVTDYQQTANA
ncbi:uncharacterized protein V6R79_008327 [Siganus canaliculatus]